MPVIENFEAVEDAWHVVDDGTAIDPEGGLSIVPLARLDEALSIWPTGARGLGVSLPNDADVNDLVPHLARLDLVLLELPAFTDGRAFSQARSLRHIHGFTGTLRVTGNFIPDQMAMLMLSGVDSFDVSDRFSVEELRSAARSIPSAYQRDYAAPAGLAARVVEDAQDWNEQPHYG